MFNLSFKIDGTMIGEGCEPYIIAEMSANHGNDINIAIETIKEAKKAGANAIKLQTYSADTITLDCKDEKYFIKEGPWKGKYLYDLYVDASMPWDWTPKLIKVAKEVGITLFSSPFDYSAVDFLEKLDVPAYKIASAELIDLPLIRKIAKTGKPIIMSTGFSTLSEINSACQVLIEEGVRDVAILKCTAEYPANEENINLKTIEHLKESFGCVVGLSDHTLGTAVPIASVALGAQIIEKHFIVDKSINTADSFFSSNPEELKELVDGVKMVYKAIGKISYPIKEPKSQRSLIAIEDIKKGDTLIEGKNFKSLRPGGGIAPYDLEKVQGRVSSKNIKRGVSLTWEMLGSLA